MAQARKMLFQVLLVILALIFSVGIYYYNKSNTLSVGNFGAKHRGNTSVEEALFTISEGLR